MQPEERDTAYLWDMLAAAKEVQLLIGSFSLEQFEASLLAMRATERCIELIGEAARRVSVAGREAHVQIPWADIIGQRNILAHEYGQIDYELLYRTATEDVPQLIDILEKVLPIL